MKFKLDYDKMLFLDAEDLAEAGIKEAYQSMMRALGQYVSEPTEVQEVVDNKAPSYVVKCAGLEYVIYSPALPDVEGRSWGRAAHAFFKIVNDQLTKSEYRLYAINGGNDLGGMFLTQSEREAARESLPRKEDWSLPANTRTSLVRPASRLASQASDVGSIPIARSISLDDSIALMRLSR
jgi:hypothetical protein